MQRPRRSLSRRILANCWADVATLIIPRLDEVPWPTLGPQLCDWIEAHLTYGPGELVGEPYVIEPEKRAWIYRMYEVVPRGQHGEGRRRFNRVGLNVRKGLAKTELAAIIAACELHPEAPVRCDGWDADGQPVGVGVRSPYVAMVAANLDQAEELGFNVLRTILGESDLADDFDIGLERILVLDDRGRAAGKAEPLSGTPGARDGARTTHQSFDETHRMVLPRQMKAHTTMLQNTYKRVQAQAWTLETTTMFDPSELSVGADTHAYAQEVHEGRMKDSRLFYFYRYAPPELPMETPEEVRSALLEASGPGVSWSGDMDGLVSHWFEPRTDRNYYKRVWLNQKVAGGGYAFDSVKWADLADATHVVPDRAKIVLGFDGSRHHDGTALVACELETGFMWLAGYWQSDGSDPDWEVPGDEVEQRVAQMFSRYKVQRMYADPYLWVSELGDWAGKYGDHVVLTFATRLVLKTGVACMSFAQSITAGQLNHDGGSVLAEHVGNAFRQDTNLRADDDAPVWTISKERSGSPRKIDAAMAAVLAWQARNDVMAKGALKRSGRVASFN